MMPRYFKFNDEKELLRMIGEYDEVTLEKVHKLEMKILKDFMSICDKNELRYFGLAGTGIGAVRHKGFIPWDDDIDIGLPREDFDRFIELVKIEFPDTYEVLNTSENENYPLMTTRLVLKGTTFKEFAVKDVDCNFGIFLDLYPFDNVSDDNKLLKKQARSAWFWSKLLILRSIPHPVLAFSGITATVVQFICAFVHYTMRIMHISKKMIYKRCLRACTLYNHLPTKRIAFLCDTSAYTNMFELSHLYPLQKLQFEDVQLNFPADLDGHLKGLFGDYMKLPPVEKRKNHFPFQLDFGDFDE